MKIDDPYKYLTYFLKFRDKSTNKDYYKIRTELFL